MKSIILPLLFLTILMLSGCASIYTYEKSKDEVVKEKAIELRATENEVMVGVNITRLEILKKNWGKQVISAIIDGIVGWGVKIALDKGSERL